MLGILRLGKVGDSCLSVSVNICLGAFCIALAMSQLFHWKDFCGTFFSAFRKAWCPSERLSHWRKQCCASAPIRRQKSMFTFVCICWQLGLNIKKKQLWEEMWRRKRLRGQRNREGRVIAAIPTLSWLDVTRTFTLSLGVGGGEQFICGKQTKKKKRYTHLKFRLKMKPKTCK